MSTPEPPAELIDGLPATVEKDGRVKFALTRKRKAFAHLTLPANQAGEIAANALGGAYDAHDQALMGLVPPAERKTSYPFVRITGLGLGPCTIDGPRLPRRPRRRQRARPRLPQAKAQGVRQMARCRRVPELVTA